MNLMEAVFDRLDKEKKASWTLHSSDNPSGVRAATGR